MRRIKAGILFVISERVEIVEDTATTGSIRSIKSTGIFEAVGYMAIKKRSIKRRRNTIWETRLAVNIV
jgi:hypothetical protein